jgi:hypothetical protein
MDYKERTSMLARMRCMECRERPTSADVTQMMEVFGHELRPDDGPKLRWRCLACVEKARKKVVLA